MSEGIRVEFVVDDFVVACRVMRQVPAAGEHAWIGECRYRVTEVTWFLDEGERADGDVADVRLIEVGRPGRPEIIDDEPASPGARADTTTGGPTPG